MLLLVVCVTAGLPATTSAAFFSQGFPAAGEVSPGMMVSLTAQGVVEAATVDNVGDLLGIAVEADGAPVAIASSSEQEVQVVTTGRAAVLVSDLNGSVKRGDPVTVSPISGVGMKLGGDVNQKIIGFAQADATDSVTQQLPSGNRQVKISRVPVLVSVSFYASRTGPLTYLQQAGTTVAGRPISGTKALLATLVLLVGIMSVSVLLYTAIRSSLISIGRNPLSASAVRGALLKVLLVAPLILGTSLILIYAILRS